MKKNIVTIAIAMYMAVSAMALEPTFMFLHESVGENLVNRGNVRSLLTQAIPQAVFYDWVTIYGHNDVLYLYNYFLGDSSHKQQMLDMADIIVFKSCYTAGGLNWHTDEEILAYRAMYTEIINELRTIDDHIFIMIGYVPYREVHITPERALLNWEFHLWLEQQAGGNVFFFDYYRQMIDEDLYLVDEYENQYNIDAHPNSYSDSIMGPIFVDFIVNFYLNSGISPVETATWGKIKKLFK